MVMPAVTNPNDLYNSMVIKQLFKTEDGAWALYEKTWTKVAETGVSAIHLNCEHWNRMDLKVHDNLQHAASWYLDEDNSCWTCGSPVPEEIRTVYMLHEYGADRLHKYDLFPKEEEDHGMNRFGAAQVV